MTTRGQSEEREAFLVLEDGSVHRGYAFGAVGAESIGEVVFNTSMVGYQEMLTDPSYGGQILVPTYPLQGNYGINDRDVESSRIQVRGFVVREACDQPSNRLSTRTLDDFLRDEGVPGIYGVDTRALTRRLRMAGVMMGIVTTDGRRRRRSNGYGARRTMAALISSAKSSPHLRTNGRTVPGNCYLTRRTLSSSMRA